MNTGKTLFAQLMDFLPWTTFTRIVDRYGGDPRVRTLSCAEQYRSLAFAQLTYRESLRDIETCLSVHASKLYHMGFRQPVRRSTLADANERRDWRIHAALAQRLITPGEDAVRRRRTGVGADQYRLRPGLDDHRSVPVGLSVGALPHHQGGGEDAHAARPAGQHSEFYPHLGWQTARRSCPRYALAGKPEPSTSWIVATSTLPAFMCCTKPGPSSSRVPSRTSMLIASIRRPTDRSTGIICDQTISLDGFYTRQDYPELLRRIRFKDPESGKTLVFITNNLSLPAATICALYKSRWQGELFFKWIKQPLRIKQFYGTSENAVKTQIWIAVSVYVRVAIVKKRLDLDASLYTLLQILSGTLFEKMPIHQALAGDENRCNAS